jgi:hypothetical protein
MSFCLTSTCFYSLVRTSEPHPLSSVIDVLGRPGLCLSSAPVRQIIKALQVFTPVSKHLPLVLNFRWFGTLHVQKLNHMEYFNVSDHVSDRSLWRYRALTVWRKMCAYFLKSVTCTYFIFLSPSYFDGTRVSAVICGSALQAALWRWGRLRL